MSSQTPHTPEEKWTRYETRASYATLNEKGAGTRAVWMVFHGIGYLARYFLRHFRGLDPSQHYLIAPQAPSLYYLTDAYTHVGACWLTREQTHEHMENLLGYLKGVAKKEAIDSAPHLCLLGYSQGVSVLLRWVALSKQSCDTLVLYAGRPPAELKPGDFTHLPESANVILVYGKEDPYLRGSEKPDFIGSYRELFGKRLRVLEFEGGHEVREELIEKLAREYGNS